MAKKTLYLMRHGQTLFNQRRKIQGWSDSPLTELGKKQPLHAKKYFEDHGIVFDHAYASTQERASDTLELALPTPMPYERLKGLKEMNFGLFEGESEDLHPPRRPDQKTHEDTYVRFGGEAMEDVQTRISETLTEIMTRENHENVLAVSHSGAMYFFALKWFPTLKLGVDTAFSNCCILKFEYEAGTFTFIEGIDHDFDQKIEHEELFDDEI